MKVPRINQDTPLPKDATSPAGELGHAPGGVVAYRGSGTTLVYARTDENGLDWGFVREASGHEYYELPVISILAHGYWYETLNDLAAGENDKDGDA